MCLIIKREFSIVFRMKCFYGAVIFIKKFKKKDTYIYNGYDLRSIYMRDRSINSEWGYKTFYKKKILRKYLPLWSKAIGNCLLITKSRISKTQNLESMIDKKSKKWLVAVKTLTEDLRLADLIFDGMIPKFVRNGEVWGLKKELQIIEPLTRIMTQNKAIKLSNSLGENKYFVHGDLQPKNLILDGSNLEIVDFEESFVGPKNWDDGFLWGNLIYLSGNNKNIFNTIIKVWSKLSERHTNFIIISVAVCLMRVFMFPLKNYNSLVVNRLTKFCLINIKKVC